MSGSHQWLMPALMDLWTSDMFWKGLWTQFTHINQPSALPVLTLSNTILAILRTFFYTLGNSNALILVCGFIFFARLKQLEQEVVGGEQARNNELQRRHRQRKNLADQRKDHLIRALSEDGVESENVLLNVYNSIQEEVYGKSQMLLKVQGKVGGQLGRTIWSVAGIK